MKQYTNNDPSFSESVEILETTDTNHADNFNVATKKLMDNTLALKKEVEAAKEESHDFVDDTTGKKVKMGIDNGLVYFETIDETETVENA